MVKSISKEFGTVDKVHFHLEGYDNNFNWKFYRRANPHHAIKTAAPMRIQSLMCPVESIRANFYNGKSRKSNVCGYVE